MTVFSPIETPYPIFTTNAGEPLNAGYVYIGQPGLEARSSPKASFFDAAGTIPTGTAIGAAVRTSGGFANYNGAVRNIFVDGDFSITVTDKNGVIILSDLNCNWVLSDSLRAQEEIAKNNAALTLDTRAALIAATVATALNRVTVLGVGDFERDAAATYPAATSNGGTVKWVPAVNRDVTAKHFGAIADGADTGSAFTGTDNTAAFQQALNYCGQTVRRLKATAGKYRFAPITLANTHMLTLNFSTHSIYGDGEFLIDDDLANSAAFKAFIGTNAIGASTSRTLRNSFKIEGVTLRGRWTHSPANTGGTHAFYLENFAEVVWDNISVFDIRGKASLGRYYGNVRVTNSRFERIASDCLRFLDANNATITGNSLKWIDDDAIALPAPSTLTAAERTNITITGNTLEQCESILVLGGKNVTITGNTLKFSKSSAIYVGGLEGAEGATATLSLNVSDNVIIDPIMRYVSPLISTQTDGSAAITVSSLGMSAVTTSGYPGQPNTAGTAFIHPVDTLDSAGAFLSYTYDPTVKTVPAGYNFIVANNTVMRTLPPTAAFSNYGQGLMFSALSGFVDPAVMITNFQKHALMVNSDSRAVAFSGNTVSGFPNGAGVYLQVIAATVDKDLAFNDILISGNIITDCKYGVSHNQISTAAVPFSWLVKVIANLFDCDKYHTSSARTSPLNGTWQAGIGVTARPVGVCHRGSKGWVIENNTIANAYDAVLGQGTGFEQNAVVLDNTLICDPVAVGFSASNGGIGDIGNGGDRFIHIVTMCDPRVQTSRSVTLTRTVFVVTATSTAHGLTVGTPIIIAGADQGGYNGQWIIDSVTANTFTFTITTNPTTPATGTITATPPKYGAHIWAPLSESAAIPTVGKYVTGHYVRNSAPTTAASKTTLGWVRQTVGPLHAAAGAATADWAPLVVATS